MIVRASDREGQSISCGRAILNRGQDSFRSRGVPDFDDAYLLGAQAEDPGQLFYKVLAIFFRGCPGPIPSRTQALCEVPPGTDRLAIRVMA